MQEPEKQPEQTIDRHPLITLGVLTAGTQLTAALILRLSKHPLILFGMGVTAGVYTYKNRKEILQEALHITKQSKKLITRKSKSESE
jgi:zinc transporter ZupT